MVGRSRVRWKMGLPVVYIEFIFLLRLARSLSRLCWEVRGDGQVWGHIAGSIAHGSDFGFVLFQECTLIQVVLDRA